MFNKFILDRDLSASAAVNVSLVPAQLTLGGASVSAPPTNSTPPCNNSQDRSFETRNFYQVCGDSRRVNGVSGGHQVPPAAEGARGEQGNPQEPPVSNELQRGDAERSEGGDVDTFFSDAVRRSRAYSASSASAVAGFAPSFLAGYPACESIRVFDRYSPSCEGCNAIICGDVVDDGSRKDSAGGPIR